MGWGIPRYDSNYPPHFFLTSKVHYIRTWNRSRSFHPPFQWGCSLIKSRITFTYIIIPPPQEAAKSFLRMHTLPRPWRRFPGVLLKSLPFCGGNVDRLYQQEILLNRIIWRLKWNTFSYLEQKKTAAPGRDYLVQANVWGLINQHHLAWSLKSFARSGRRSIHRSSEKGGGPGERKWAVQG